MHSSFLASLASDERSMYSYLDVSNMAATDMDSPPMPVDAAAALAAAFGIEFDDMANDRTSPLDQRGREPSVPVPHKIPATVCQAEYAYEAVQDKNTPPLDAAAALAASFGIGFDLALSTGGGCGVSTPVGGITEPPSWQMNNTPPHCVAAETCLDVPNQKQEDDSGGELPVDAAASLAAFFGLGFENEESRDRRLGNVGTRGKVNVTAVTQREDQASKSSGARTRKKFKKRTGTTRERTGCLTCRQRRKKCDDNTYPICGHCRRLNLECVREAPRPIHISVGNTTPYSPTQPATAASFYDGQTSLSTAYTPSPYQQNALSTRRQSSGSISGDLSRVTMHGVNFRISIPPCLSQPSSSPDTSSTGGSDRRYLLKYYTQVLASLVTTNHENNSFLSVFLPMAIDSPPLLSALTAWSCAHLSRYHELYAQPLLHRRGAALRLMAESLASPSPSLAIQETLLAASLVLCSTEVINGDTDGMWLRHLEGASLIIKSAKNGKKYGPEALRGSGDGEWLLRNFAYHDVLGSVTLGKPPLIKGDYWLEEDRRTRMVDTYMGVGSEILAFISEISCLLVPGDQQGSKDNVTMDVDDTSFNQRSDELEHGLLAWTAPDAIQPGLVPLAEAWRSAALLCLYRKKRTYIQTLPSPTMGGQHASGINTTSTPLSHLSSLIAHTTTSILTSLSLIPPSSLPESGVLFPIFLAGGETKKGEEMEVILRRLKEMEEFRGFANIGKATECLEEVWRCWGRGVKGSDGKGGEKEVGWEDVCSRRGWVLMLA